MMKIITPAIVGHLDKGMPWCKLYSYQITINSVAVKEMGIENAKQLSIFFDDQDGHGEKKIWIGATPKGNIGFDITDVKKSGMSRKVRSSSLMKHIFQWLEIENLPKSGIMMNVDTAITVTNFGTTLYQLKK